MPIELSDIDLDGSTRIKNCPNPISPGDVVNLAYLLSVLTSALKPPVGLNCSANPIYPPATAGDQWRVTVAGKIGGNNGNSVQIGDIIGCQTSNSGGDEATAGGNFYIIQGNVDQATATVLGLVMIATQEEVNNGSNALKVVTPATLAARLASFRQEQRYTTTVGNGSSNTFTITHNLNTMNPSVTVRQTNSPRLEVMVDNSVVDSNSITLGQFVVPPSTNQYTVTVSA